jgi:hypothetical protein
MLILFQKIIKEMDFKIDIGSKGNTNAIAEDNFNPRTGYNKLVSQISQLQVTHLHNLITLRFN